MYAFVKKKLNKIIFLIKKDENITIKKLKIIKWQLWNCEQFSYEDIYVLGTDLTNK